METGTLLLCSSCVAVAVIHTLAGPDHYVPFVAMARARNWSWRRTSWVTLACGAGHLTSSIGLGIAAARLGVELQRVAHIESVRGSLATWGLFAFGAVYFVWGLRRAARAQAHVHGHWHPAVGFHQHGHAHRGEHMHVHDVDREGSEPARSRSITPWVLFAIFVFGPCEPMIPLVMVPAAQRDWLGVGLVSVVFGAVTLLAMLGAVLLGLYGVQRIRLGATERYTHALAGLTLLLTGGAMAAFGL